jgi:hypothetical protein
MNRGYGVVGALLVAGLAIPGTARAQLPASRPDPFHLSVGGAWAVPEAHLARQDPDDGRYGRPGRGLVERFGWYPGRHWGLFLQGYFPVMGVDAAAVQRDFEADPAVRGGRNEVTGWLMGLRLRRFPEPLRGPYLEGSIGWYRHRLELDRQDGSRSTQANPWQIGAGGAAGWMVPVGGRFGFDLAVEMHEFREDYFVNRWWGVRMLAVLTFGGEG